MVWPGIAAGRYVETSKSALSNKSDNNQLGLRPAQRIGKDFDEEIDPCPS